MNTPYFLRRLAKVKSLRFINLLGLVLMFTCVFVSYTYITKELSYDKFYTKSDRIARLTLAFDGNQPDGRLFGDTYAPILKNCPEIEETLKFTKIQTATVIHNDEKYVVNDILLTSGNFFTFFDLPFVQGTLPSAFDSKGKIVISERMAIRLFGQTDVIGQKIGLNSRRLSTNEGFISGVYKDIPDNSHLHSDIIIYGDNFEKDNYCYTYLLLKDKTDTQALADKLTGLIQADINKNKTETVLADVMPLADIHLHSRILRELESNGNINYVYLIGGANILLLIIVLFNLWLNSNVIFSYHRRYYQLLRLNGASSFEVIKDEISIATFLGGISLIFGILLSFFLNKAFGISGESVNIISKIGIAALLLICTVLASLLPAIQNMVSTTFSNQNYDLRTKRFSFSNVRYMLVVQYAIVIFIIIVAAGIKGQMSVIKTNQIGAENDSILVLKEQPQEVIDKFRLFKQELLKHSEIEMVTAAMQLPGEAVRDGIFIKKEDGGESIYCPILIVGEDFFPFFNIKPVSGELPPPLVLTQEEEAQLLTDRFEGKENKTSIRDNYIINRSALKLLGYSSPDEAIGKELILDRSIIDYIPSGRICGVVDDFVFSTVFEEATPMLVIQRNMFMNCFMLHLAPDNTEKALGILNKVWADVNPGYPLDYSFLKDSYKVVYHNELNAERIVNLFSGLCLAITILGLIVFMAFMIKTRTKEIGIRKINGASGKDILYMLNRSLLTWIALAFIIAIPVSKYVMDKWLENFAYKASLPWWLFMGAGVSVMLISVIAVSWQCRHATRINPVEGLKSN
ncbi:ABC transporter permease [Dysgonomonas macrotermitis]|uniref:Putative ABC transport system permease protein n=1 Tax=Dysgonomonas macrotermitis TaxID=1346286 RepID=A0A1M4Z8U4_9BACT|nr:ABC transporter permease [Dysgonomonas macrotermitis]SHF14227.1 putative ABC transport system permease protein [Dysgonomonas macrotermitis]